MEKDRERWKELAEQASKEKDPDRLIALVRELSDLLESKEKRLGTARASMNNSE